MNTTDIPADLRAIARARGLDLEAKAGTFTVRHGQTVRLVARDVGELRRWLRSVASIMRTA